MNASNHIAVWENLKSAGLVQGDMPDEVVSDTPWYIRVMLGFAGWIGAMFLFAFVGAGFVFALKSAASAGVIGIALCVAAMFMFRKNPDSDFFSQFAFAISLAGQTMLVYGLIMAFESNVKTMAIIIGIIASGLFLLIPNYLHRIWSAVVVAYAFIYTVNFIPQYILAAALLAACVYIWLSEFKFARYGNMAAAFGYGLAFVTIMSQFKMSMVVLAGLRGGPAFSTNTGAYAWLGTGLIGLIMVFTVYKIMKNENVSMSSGVGRFVLGTTIALGIATMPVPGAGLSMTILVLGYAHGNRVLTSLGAAGMLFYTSQYYYFLEFTLMEKSIHMVTTGIIILVIRAGYKRLASSGGVEEAPYA